MVLSAVKAVKDFLRDPFENSWDINAVGRKIVKSLNIIGIDVNIADYRSV